VCTEAHNDVPDWACNGSFLILSDLALGIDGSEACGSCYLGMVSASTASGPNSIERGTGSFPFAAMEAEEKYLSLMARKLKDTDAEEDLIESFKVCDLYGNSFITAAELGVKWRWIFSPCNHGVQGEVLVFGGLQDEGH